MSEGIAFFAFGTKYADDPCAGLGTVYPSLDRPAQNCTPLTRVTSCLAFPINSREPKIYTSDAGQCLRINTHYCFRQ